MNFNRINTKWGEMFHLAGDNDSLLTLLAKKGSYQPYIIDLAQKCTKDNPNKNIIDIGANIGVHSIPIAKGNKLSIVYAFEPCPENFLSLEQNKKHHNLDNLRIFSYGLGARNEQKTFYQVPSRRGASSFDKTGLDLNTVVKKELPIYPLDDFLYSLEDVGFIKIDVQNFEYQVLLGAQKLIERDHPAIMVECPARDMYEKDEYRKITKLLSKLGYMEIKRYNKDCLFVYQKNN